MLGIVLTGHGGFASGLYQACAQIMGEQPQFVAVNFPDDMSTEELENSLRDAINQCNNGDGVVFLTDILGGSPFRTASMLSFELPNTEVITGTNMPMLLDLLLSRSELNSESLRQHAITTAQQGVTSLWHESQQNSKSVKKEQDGI